MDNTATFDDLNLDEGSLVGLAISVGAAAAVAAVSFFTGRYFGRKLTENALEKKMQEFAKLNGLKYHTGNVTVTPKAATV